MTHTQRQSCSALKAHSLALTSVYWRLRWFESRFRASACWRKLWCGVAGMCPSAHVSGGACRVVSGELLRCLHLCFTSLFYFLSYALSIVRFKSESRFEMSAAGSALSANGDHERGPRRPRRYFTPGENRKTSERFKTQPITSAERKETDR